MAGYKQHKKHTEEEGGEAWLLPYSDLMTLLLAVFIVLFAVSKMDEGKAQEMAESFQGMSTQSKGIITEGGGSIIPHRTNGQNQNTPQTDGTGGGESSDSTEAEDNTETADSTKNEGSPVSEEELKQLLGEKELENLIVLRSELKELVEDGHMSDSVSASIDTRGLVVSLNNAIVFDSGSADIKKENENTLIRIAQIINKLDNYIRIEGHTDNRPINTSVYPSNWELSAARAARVVRLFIDKCNVSPEKVVAVGYGEYNPVADNSSEEGRRKNRRIDIIVLSEKYNNLENHIQE